jgi:hypothetical protein
MTFQCRRLSGKSVSVPVSPQWTISDAKASLATELGVQAEKLLLMTEGRVLADHENASITTPVILFCRGPMRPPPQAPPPYSRQPSPDLRTPADYRWRIACTIAAAPFVTEEAAMGALRECGWDFTLAANALKVWQHQALPTPAYCQPTQPRYPQQPPQGNYRVPPDRTAQGGSFRSPPRVETVPQRSAIPSSTPPSYAHGQPPAPHSDGYPAQTTGPYPNLAVAAPPAGGYGGYGGNTGGGPWDRGGGGSGGGFGGGTLASGAAPAQVYSGSAGASGDSAGRPPPPPPPARPVRPPALTILPTGGGASTGGRRVP